MTNEELRSSIAQNILSDDFMVLQCVDTALIANQYASYIAESKDLELVYISELSDLDGYISPFDDYCPYLFVLHADKFEELSDDYSRFANVIVICKSIDKKVVKFLGDYIIKMDKLEKWQLVDYINTRCPGIDLDLAGTIYELTQGNVDRIETLLDQLAVFDIDEQATIFKELVTQPHTDLYFNTAFNLCDAITNLILNVDVNQSIAIIKEILLHRNCCDITTLYVVTILLGKLRNIALLCYGGKAKAVNILNKEGKPMSDKQYGYYKRAFAPAPNVKERNMKALAKAIDFLSSIDSELKTGKIELSEEYFLDYVITSLLS